MDQGEADGRQQSVSAGGTVHSLTWQSSPEEAGSLGARAEAEEKDTELGSKYVDLVLKTN